MHFSGKLKLVVKSWSSEDGFGSGLIYASIAFTVILFNLMAITGLHILLHDDPANYYNVLFGHFPRWALKHNLIYPFTEWFAWNIMVYSPYLARGLYILLLMVPISCCFYYLCHKRYGFSKMTAFAAAVLPNILPLQWQIPAGINMSYILWALLFSLASLIMGFKYLEKDTSENWPALSGAVLLYFIATQITEQAVFLFPPFALAFLVYKKLVKKNIILISGLAVCAFFQLIRAIINPREPAIIYLKSFEEAWRRITLFFQWSLPFPDIPPVYLIIIFLLVVLAGFILYLRRNDGGPVASKIFLYLFLLLWVVSTILVFICMTRDYTVRYSYVASFGMNALFVFSLYNIFNAVSGDKYRLYIPVFVALVIFSGVSRHVGLEKIYSSRNLDVSIVKRSLAGIVLPPGSQIIITDLENITHSNRGHRRWHWRVSNGYLQYALKREDVTGLILSVRTGAHYNFDDYFSGDHNGGKNLGLTVNKPTFLFRMDKESGRLQQLEYALQWQGEGMDAPWTILRADKTTGNLRPFVSGAGMAEYNSAVLKLGKKGVIQPDILWGGPPSQREKERLNRGK